MKIKQKILLSLSMLVVMIGTAFAGPSEMKSKENATNYAIGYYNLGDN